MGLDDRVELKFEIIGGRGSVPLPSELLAEARGSSVTEIS